MTQISSRRTALVAALTAAPMALVLSPAGPASAVWGTAGCYPVDTVPPIVSLVTMDPTSVDARAGAKKVHVTASVTDSSPRNEPISGVASMSVELWDPSSVIGHNLVSGVLTRSAGTAEDGTWTGDVTIPPWVSGGDAGATWYLSLVAATDRAGNVNTYTTNPEFPNGTAPDDIAKTNWDKTVTVMSTPDTTPPRITDFAFSPKDVDTTADAKKVVVVAHAADAAAGVRSVQVQFTQASPFHAAGGLLKRVRGTANRGTWKGTVLVRQWVGDGAWLATVSVSDRIGNFRSYPTDELKAHGWPRKLTVTSRSESRKPVLRDLAYTPHTVDVRDAAKTVKVTGLVARDRKSGVATAVVQFDGPEGSSFSATLHRIDGTANLGTWVGRVRIPHCGPAQGTYRTSVFLQDRAGNFRTYGSKRLHDLGLPSTLTVKANVLDTTAPGMAGDGYGNNSGPILVTFSEDVTGVTTESLQLYDTQTFDAAAMDHFTCVDAAFAVVDCETGQVRRVSMYPALNATQDSMYYVYANQHGVDVQVRDLVGNPAPWETLLGSVFLTSS